MLTTAVEPGLSDQQNKPATIGGTVELATKRVRLNRQIETNTTTLHKGLLKNFNKLLQLNNCVSD